MDETKRLFSNRQLFQLLWPLIIEQLLNVLVGMIDVVMVASLGEAAVSGVSLVDSINQLVIQFLAALTAGGTVVCSRFIGMKNNKKASESAGQLVFITVTGALAVAILFILSGKNLLSVIFGQVENSVMDNAYIYFIITSLSFPFLALYNSGAALFRSVGNSKISMRVSILMNGLNIIGNAICIFGLHMRVSGVAIPTLISRMVAAILIFYLLEKRNNEIRINGIESLKPDKKILSQILSIGIPTGIESGMFHFGKLILQSLVSTLGTASIAGYAVACNLVMFLYLPGNALGLGLTTVVGQCIGAGEPKQAKQYTNRFIMLDYAFLLALTMVLGIFNRTWIGLYNLSDQASLLASGLIISHCIAMIVWPIAFLLPHSLRAANDAKFTMIIAIVSMWVFRVLLAYFYIKVMRQNVLYIWYAMYADWLFRAIIFFIRYRKYTHRISNQLARSRLE